MITRNVKLAALGFVVGIAALCHGDDLPTSGSLKAIHLFTVPNYCEGVVFDHEGKGYISHADTITQFTVDGKHRTWVKTGAPNGHKVLPTERHLVCDASQHAVLHLSATGEQLPPASRSATVNLYVDRMICRLIHPTVASTSRILVAVASTI